MQSRQNFFMSLLKAPELYIGMILIAIVSLFCVNKIGVTDVMLAEGDGSPKATSFPVVKKFEDPFTVSFKIRNRLGHQFDLRIIPDDCATVVYIDGNPLNLKNRKGLCDYSNGFVLRHDELKALDVHDRSQFDITLWNNGGDGGLNVLVENSENSLIDLLTVASILLSGLFAFLVARRFQVGVGFALILALGVVMRSGFYMELPKYDMFGHDVDGHVAYVHYIAENFTIPKSDDCWTCYHPPVYYGMSLPAWGLSQAAGVQGVDGLLLESLILSVLFLFIGFAFFKQFMRGGPLAMATVMLALWPVLILSAPRIGNDQLFYVLHALCLWGGAKYLNGGKGEHLLMAAIATALSVWTKSTGVVTVGTFTLFALIGYLGNCKRLAPSKSEVMSWCVFGLTLLGIFIDKFVGESNLVGNAQSLHSGLQVGKAPSNFLFFDLKGFLTEPYTSPWKDGLGREFFLNYALKTSLFGEFKLLETVTGRWLASFTGFAFLGLVVYALRGFWKTKLNGIHWILFLQAAAFLLALAFLRYKIPFSCSNDFRYIVPSLLSLIPFVALGVNPEGASLKWKVLGYILVASFVILSAVLMISVAWQWV